MSKYKKIYALGITTIHDQELDIWIPCDPENTDYQAYLEWEAAGNTPTEWSPE